MNLFPYILGTVWVLDVVLTPDGHTIVAWRCRAGREPVRTDYDAAAVAKGVAAVTVSGHGTVAKSADSQLAARVRDDGATFLWSEHAGQIAFVRRERLHGVLAELTGAGIHPQAVFVALAPDAAAARWREGFRWRQLLHPTAEGSSLAQAVVRRAALPVLGFFLCLLAANAALAPSLGTRRRTLQAELSVRERTVSTAADVTARQRALLEEFSAPLSVPRAVLCDRIAAAVPEQVVLTRLAVEPLAVRFEAEKPLQRQERTVVVAGTAPAAGDVSAFVERLAGAARCRTVRLTHVERERDAERLVFRIEIGL